MIDYNYIRMLNDNDTFLVKTSLLLYVYSYYCDNNVLDDNLERIFNQILSSTKISKTKNYIEPEYFKMSVKDIKIIFAKAPNYIYTNSSFKEISKSK